MYKRQVEFELDCEPPDSLDGPVGFVFATEAVPCDGENHLVGTFVGFGSEEIRFEAVARLSIGSSDSAPDFYFQCTGSGRGSPAIMRGVGVESGRTVEVEIKTQEP